MDHCLSSERRALVNEKLRAGDVNIDEPAADFLEKRKGACRREPARRCLSKETALEREAVAATMGLIAANGVCFLHLLFAHVMTNEINE